MGCAANSEPCGACDELAGQWIRRPRTNVPQNPLLTGSNACSSAPGATQVQECAAHPVFAADGLHVERRRDRTTSLVPPAARRAHALHDHSLPPIENHVNVPGSSHMPSSFRASPLISLRFHQTFSSTTHGIAGDIGTTGSRLACKGSSQNPSQRPIAVPNKPVFLLADPVIAREDRVAITYSRRRSQPSVSKASLASVAAAGGVRPCVVIVCRSLASSRTQRQLPRSVCRVPSISSEVSYQPPSNDVPRAYPHRCWRPIQRASLIVFNGLRQGKYFATTRSSSCSGSTTSHSSHATQYLGASVRLVAVDYSDYIYPGPDFYRLCSVIRVLSSWPPRSYPQEE
jgi:hypothetical protein